MCARLVTPSTRSERVVSLRDVRPVSLARATKHAGRARIASSAAAWARARQAIAAVGITRLADITGLDTTGIPTWSAVRPLADRFSVSVTCGKGLRSLDARVGAVMEAVEYFSAEPAGRCCVARMAELDGPAVDPVRLTLPAWSRAAGSETLAWCGGWDLVQHRAVWLPANAVYFPFEDQPGRFLFTPTTNGLAAGLSIEEATCHALAELIERDAWSLVCARVWSGEPLDHRPALDLRTVPRSARSALACFARAGVEVTVRVITSDITVPAFHAMSVEHRAGFSLIHEGMGAHPDAEVAVLRAITEVAQSRAADIQGSREDLTYWRARAAESSREARLRPSSLSRCQTASLDSVSFGPAPPGSRLDREDLTHASRSRAVKTPRGVCDAVNQPAASVSFASIPTFASRDIRDDIEWMVTQLREAGLDQVIVVDLTSPRVGLPVVRVVVPGLEVMCVDPWRAGRRVEAARTAPSSAARRGV